MKTIKTLYFVETYLYDRWYLIGVPHKTKRQATEETKTDFFKGANWDDWRIVKFIRAENP